MENTEEKNTYPDSIENGLELRNETALNSGGNNILLGIGLALVLAAAAFFSGLQIGSDTRNEAGLFAFFQTKDTQPDSEVDMSEFWRVWNLLEEKYVATATTTEITEQALLYGAIEGLTNAYGDPYTVFLPPVDASKFEEDISGNFSGVGMEVGIRDGLITVIAPLPDTPAERAGLVPGDVIVKIDDTKTDGMSIDAAVRLIRGEAGTEVIMTIFREGELEFLEVPVVRDTIKIPTIVTSQFDDVYVIKLISFNAIAEDEMKKALRQYVESGSDKLILDLRGNPGGYLQGAVNIASYFLPAGKIVVRENFGGSEEEKLYRSVTGRELGRFAPKDMVILVDQGSASASEILAGALSEHGVATLIGGQTFGKGSVQELVQLDDGSSLKVTIARWLTPQGISISEGGLTPDIPVERTPQQFVADEDPQLEAALRWLGGDKDPENYKTNLLETE